MQKIRAADRLSTGAVSMGRKLTENMADLIEYNDGAYSRHARPTKLKRDPADN
jgi:hypothetical protein